MAASRTSVLIVDDHAAVRAGLVALLEEEDALEVLPPAAGAGEAFALAERRAPEVALLDVSLGDGDGLRLCLQLKQLPGPPGVLLYTASSDPLLSLKARLVGADALISKSATAGELQRAIAAVARGGGALPPPDQELLEGRSERLSPEGLAIVGMRLNETPVHDVGEVLGLRPSEVVRRIGELLERIDGSTRPAEAVFPRS